jgi:high affinity sulfate transporter 1
MTSDSNDVATTDRDQPAAAGAPSGLLKWVPGVATLRGYRRDWLGRDLIAGLVLSSLLVPQGMAYAELAGLPAINGLYTTVVCLVAYALFGPSPRLVLGPDSSLGPMIAAAILPLAAADPTLLIPLAGVLAIMVGVVCAGAGAAKLGFVADLLSKPVRVGYMAGLAVTIVVGQLPKLLGVSIDADSFLGELRAIWASVPNAQIPTLAVGLLTLGILVGLKRWAPKLPGVLFAVLAAILVTAVLDLAARGVSTVGVLPQGFPLPSLPRVPLADLPILAATALGISLVAIGDTISTSASFAAREKLEIDADQELVGIGAANVMAGFFQGFPVSTSGSRTAVAEQAGGKSQLTGVVAAAAVLAMLVFLPGLVQDLPNSALAAILIVAGISLFDVEELSRLWAVRRSEFVWAAAGALGVVFVGVLQGILIAVVISMLQSFLRAWRPHWAVLGEPANVPGYHDLRRHPDAKLVPGLLILRWDAALFFANASLFRAIVRQQIAAARPTPRWVVVAAEPVNDLDSTGAEMLQELDLELNGRGQHLVFAELKDPVKDRLIRYGLLDTIDARHFYPTIEEAVEAFEAEEAARVSGTENPPA